MINLNSIFTICERPFIANRRKDIEAKAEKQLEAYLEKAVDVGATGIIFEYVPEGLEVCFMFGNSGVGTILRNRELGSSVMVLIGRRSRIGFKPRSTLSWMLRGEKRRIVVEQYDSFGETAFRLELKPLK